MEYKEVVAYLNSYRKALNEINSIKEQIAEIKYSKYSYGKWLASLPENIEANEKYLRVIANEEEMISRLAERSANLNNIAMKLEVMINSVEDPLFHNILRLRFINGHSLKMISKEIGYDYDYTRKLNKKALDSINGLIEKKADTKRHISLC